MRGKTRYEATLLDVSFCFPFYRIFNYFRIKTYRRLFKLAFRLFLFLFSGSFDVEGVVDNFKFNTDCSFDSSQPFPSFAKNFTNHMLRYQYVLQFFEAGTFFLIVLSEI